MFGDKKLRPDIESDYRFYQKRKSEDEEQSPWQFEIFQSSMNTKIQAATLVSLLYAVLNLYFQILVSQAINKIEPAQDDIEKLMQPIIMSKDRITIKVALNNSYELFVSIQDDIQVVRQGMTILYYLSILNCFLVFEHIQLFLASGKLKRVYQFPNILHFTDTICAFFSI